MRTEEFKVVTKKVKYIADDGTVFAYKSQCEDYESQLRKDVYEERLVNVRRFLIEPPNYDEYFSFEAFVVTNEEELEAVNELYTDGWEAYRHHCDKFPQVVCVVCSQGGDAAVVGGIDDFLKSYEDFIRDTRENAANLLAAATDA